MRLPRRFLAALPLLASLNGCCGLFALMCGPDKSVWVSELYRTPEEAIATFREAVRRAHYETLERAFSVAFQERHGITSVTAVAVVWERLAQQIPGLHALGSADVQGPFPEPDGRVAFLLSTSGHTLRVRLAPEASWLVRYEVDGPDPQKKRQNLVPSLADLVRFEPPGAGSDLVGRVRAADLARRRLPPLRAEQIRELRFATEWKVDQIDSAEPQQASRRPVGSDDAGG